MTYYVIRNHDGFEELVFEGTLEEAESKKATFEALLNSSRQEQRPGWSRIKYYVFPEHEWKMETGAMH